MRRAWVSLRSGQSVFSGVLMSMSAGAVTLVVGIAALPLVFSTVGAAPYGVWLFLFSTAQLLFLADLGLSPALTHYASRRRGGDDSIPMKQMLAGAVAWAGIASVISLVLYLTVAVAYTQTTESRQSLGGLDAWGLIVAGGVVVASIAARPFTAIAMGAGLFVLERRVQIGCALARFAGIVLGCFAFRSVLAVAAFEALSVAVPPVAMWIVVARRGILIWGATRSDAVAGVRFLFGFGARSFAVSALGSAILQSGTLLVGLIGTPLDVAHFNASFRIYAAVRTAIGWSVDPFRPALSRLFASAGAKEGRGAVLGLTFLSVFIAWLSVGFLVVAAPDIVRLWLGAEFDSTGIALAAQIMLVGVLLNAFHLPLTPVLDGAGKPGAFLLLHALWLAAFLVLGYFLGSTHGIIGVAVALTLPLVVLEPVYVTRACVLLGIPGQQMRRAVVGPIGVIGLAGFLVVLAAWQIPLVRTVPNPGILLAAASAVAICLSTLAIRRYLPLSDVRKALQLRL